MKKLFYLVDMLKNFKAVSKQELFLVALIGGVSGVMMALALFKSIPGLFAMSTGLLIWSIVVRLRSQDLFKDNDHV